MQKTNYNFSAGPAMLPVSVMLEMNREFLDWNGTHRSVMEISHRSQPFMQMLEQMEKDVRSLLQIPDNYRVLFVHASASHQFAMVPMNLAGIGTMDYVDTGIWSAKAIKEANKFGQVNTIKGLIEDEQQKVSLTVPAQWEISDDADFLYIATNETIGGVEFNQIPDTGQIYGKDVPLVADMSSNFMSSPIDVSKFGLIFAGAQKNIGTSGFTLVIIREDLLERVNESVATLLQYKTYATHGSLYNTPPMFPLYAASRVFNWIKQQGGLDAMAELNHVKAKMFYDYIDSSSFYNNPVAQKYRSKMNVPFFLADENLNEKFLSEAETAGLFALKGHRSVGGMRASIYNAMPREGVLALIEFMQQFSQRNRCS